VATYSAVEKEASELGISYDEYDDLRDEVIRVVMQEYPDLDEMAAVYHAVEILMNKAIKYGLGLEALRNWVRM